MIITKTISANDNNITSLAASDYLDYSVPEAYYFIGPYRFYYIEV